MVQIENKKKEEKESIAYDIAHHQVSKVWF